MIISMKPWASIPRKYMSLLQKIYSSLTIISIAYFVFYTSIYAISLFQNYQEQKDSEHHAIALLIDTSLSMSAADVTPNRYQHAIRIAQ